MTTKDIMSITDGLKVAVEGKNDDKPVETLYISDLNGGEWETHIIKENESKGESLKVYKSGKTCILKAIGLNAIKVGRKLKTDNQGNLIETDATLGWRECGLNPLPERFRPESNVFWYNGITMLQPLIFKMKKGVMDTKTGKILRYEDVEQIINNPHQVSFGLSPKGILSARVERTNINFNDTISGVNFTLIYLLK